MAKVTKHDPGMFCWADLESADQAAGTKFYASLFGWKPVDMPVGNGGTYTMFYLGEEDVAAIGGIMAKGVPSHWNNYVAVANVDAAAGKVAGLGGKLLVPPMDVLDVGRMAVVQDPTGAALCLWQPKKHAGAGRYGEFNALCWAELLTTDPATAGTFYSRLLGWETKAMPGMDYTLFQLGGKSAGGMMQIVPEMGPMPPNWMTYFAVENADATVARAAKLGAKTLVAPMDIETVGRMATIQDPQGAVFSILQPAPGMA